ncbi:MAG: lysophospholipid acyltransferase family protein [Planctomycetaceae bacterium]|nr:lysophospholipid acyltransferase family protein [Planctomycetaceae bacterium]
MRTDALTRFSHGAASLLVRMWLDSTLLKSPFPIDAPHGVMERTIDGSGAIACCWHHKLLSIVLAFRQLFGRGLCNTRIRALVSESSDGDLIARIFRDLGGNCIRGSSSRRSAEALKDVVRELSDGATVAITPDGPRGPKHCIHDGILHAARLSGKPIIPMTGSFGRYLRFDGSWDQFEVPLPFTRVRVYAGQPMYISRDAGDLETLRAELTLRMRQIGRKAEGDQQRAFAIGRRKQRDGKAIESL